MKGMIGMRLDRFLLLLCTFFSFGLLLLYSILLEERGHLRHRQQRELFHILGQDQEAELETKSQRRYLIHGKVPMGFAGGRSIKTKTESTDEATQTAPEKANGSTYLIYLCNKQKLCGDWSERQYGIVNAFLLAKMTNRTFKISMTSPCRLQHFLNPAKYDWIPDVNVLRGKSFTVISNDSNSTFLNTLKTRDFNAVYSEDIVFIRCKTDILSHLKRNPFYAESFSEWMLQNSSLVFKEAWNMLMKPSEYINDLLKDITMTNSLHEFGELTCAYVQLGTHSQSQEVYKQFLHGYIRPLLERSTKFFMASDSEEFRNITRLEFGERSLDSGGIAMDIDRDRHNKESCVALETLILDQLVLKRCYVLVVSDSTFGRTTALLRQSTSNVFRFTNSAIPYINL